ncbi:MAG: ATP-dependent dethiobiotin synthetase BioD [Lentisphaerae bacterium]|jgi:dethiobiotin synthetase|nr:ATP-dependent dethiobiotin synthetase BioD [Lentisphaerota bacterium]
MKKGIYFIGGIDTGVGKTFITGLLARYLHKNGVRVITFKLVETGSDGISQDIRKHRDLMGTGLLPEDLAGVTAPEIFKFPASPHLSAHLENRTLNLKKIRSSLNKLQLSYDVILVEGAGGLATPLTKELLTIEFVAEENWSVILVSSSRLGSLNHTIMSIEVAKSANVHIAGIVYNRAPETDSKIEEDTQQFISKYLTRKYSASKLISVPWIYDKANFPEIDFSRILKSGTK